MLRLDPDRVNPSAGLFNLGLDSLLAIELRNRLQAAVGPSWPLPATLSMDHPSIDRLSEYLRGLLDPIETQASSGNDRVEPAPSQHEPIAIIGMSCRVPGAADLAAYWQLLREGVDAIREVPPGRWDIDEYYDPDPEAPGKMYARWGGFLEGIEEFDPQFFGIAPREAMSMDPQHRLLLEAAWTALEDSGQAPDRLLGSRCGVFVGISNNEYGSRVAAQGDAAIDAYYAIGSAASAAAGRLSHSLGLQGPALSIDTACSSSLVAVHEACQSLQVGGCNMALAGGVNLILSPQLNIGLSKARMLAPDGRCKTFDAGADGYVRSEGCGIIVLKRLADAHRDRDRVLAVIRGAAVNQDGRAGGMTVPNGPAQERAIRTCARSSPASSPTPSTTSRPTAPAPRWATPSRSAPPRRHSATGRGPDRPLLIGSAKANVGHLEAAAGMAGLIKVVLAMRHGTVPPQVHFRRPSPHIPWDRLPVRVAVAAEAWPARPAGRATAGVSSFGFSGTNAHVLLEGPPPEPEPAAPKAPPRRHHILCLSARAAPALAELAGRYLDWIAEHPDADPADLCFTAGAGRAHLEHRAAIVLDSLPQAADALEVLRRGQDAPGLFAGRAAPRPRVAWLFTGQGADYPGMARRLYHAQPAFRSALDDADASLDGLLPRPLLEALFADPADDANRAPLAQAALVAVQLGLARLYRSWGLEPAAVLGHSAGEIAAAAVAGVLTAEAALRLAAARGRLMAGLPPGGAMAAVAAPAERLAAALAAAPAVALAADNRAQAVVSGPAAAVADLVGRLRAEGLHCTPLSAPVAFHSPLVEPILDDLHAAAADLEPRPAELPLVSSVTGRVLGPDERLDGSYWRRQARQPVRFASGVAALAELGCDALLELGPHPVLSGLAAACWPGGEPPPAIAALRRGGDDERQAAEALARLYVLGATPDFDAWDRHRPRRKLALPTYPFQRQRYWVEAATRTAGPHRSANPLLGTAIELAGGDRLLDTALGLERHPWLAHHVIYGTLVVPGATFAAMIAHSAGTPCRLADLVFHEPMLLAAAANRHVQIRLLAGDGPGLRSFTVHSRADTDEQAAWVLHASGLVETAETLPSSQVASQVNLKAMVAGLTPLPVEQLFAGFASLGLELGPNQA